MFISLSKIKSFSESFGTGTNQSFGVASDRP